jgi:outer membrane protein
MQNRRLYLGLAALYAALHLLPVTAHAEEAKTILDLYALAKAKDPGTGRAEARVEAGRADKDIAWAAVLPRISASASQRRFWHTVYDYGPTTIDGAYTGYNYGISGQLSLFNMSSYFQIAASNAGLQSAEASFNLAQQDLVVRLMNAYVALLKGQADEQLYRDELSRVSSILKQAEAFLKAGTGDIIAVYEARARMDSAAADLIKAEGQRRIAEQALSSLTGTVVTKVSELSLSRPKGPQPVDFAWWLEAMQKNNPAIRQAQEDLRQAGHYSKANWSGHLPTLQLQGGYTVDKGSTFLPEVETRQWFVGASISVPIYSGGETAGRTRRAVAGESERRFMLADVQDQHTNRLKEAFLNLQYNVSLAEAYQRKQESAELQLKATRKGREIGTRNAIELLNAEQTYAVSRRDLSNVLYDNLARQFELKAAAGVLTEEDLQALGTATPPTASNLDTQLDS